MLAPIVTLDTILRMHPVNAQSSNARTQTIQGTLAFASPTSAWALGIHHEACIGIARCFCRCQEHVGPERNVLVLGMCYRSMNRHHRHSLRKFLVRLNFNFGYRPLNMLFSKLLARMAAWIKQKLSLKALRSDNCQIMKAVCKAQDRSYCF